VALQLLLKAVAQKKNTEGHKQWRAIVSDLQKPLTLEEEQAIADGVDRALADATPENPKPDDLIFKTSTGAMVRPEVVDELIVQKIYAQFPEPDPPIVMIKQGSKTYPQENREDPTYQMSILRALVLRGEAMLKLYMLRFSTILELPDGVEEYNDSDDAAWIEEYEAYGFILPKTKTARHLEWMRFHIYPRSSDMTRLQERAGLLAGVTEEDVAEELARFQNSGGRVEPEPVVK